MRLTDTVIIREGPQVSVSYVAFDSFGVKSMCTRIETPELIVTIDPGVSIQTASFPLPEERRQTLLSEYRAAVAASCGRSQAIVITHYHLDHFILERNPAIYRGKVIFAKALEDLPQTQHKTATRLFKTIDGLPEETIWADGRRFKFKKTEIGFSAPIWHGQSEAEPGKVIMVDIKRGKETTDVDDAFE